MSIRYSIQKDLGVTFVVWAGVITAQDWLDHIRQLSADADWPPDKRLHLTDLRNASLDASIDEAAIHQASELFGSIPNWANMKVAIVADETFHTAVSFGSEVFKHVPSTIVFNGHNLSVACTWLGVDTAKADEIIQSLRAAR
jgi:hypothetical protein